MPSDSFSFADKWDREEKEKLNHCLSNELENRFAGRPGFYYAMGYIFGQMERYPSDVFWKVAREALDLIEHKTNISPDEVHDIEIVVSQDTIWSCETNQVSFPMPF